MESFRIMVLVIVAIGFCYVALPIMMGVYSRFRGRRTVRCPETGRPAEVEIDAWHAAATAIPGPPRMSVSRCSRWPEHQGCGQECVAGPEPG